MPTTRPVVNLDNAALFGPLRISALGANNAPDAEIMAYARAHDYVVVTYLDAIRPLLDIDGNGTADALTDGLLIVRYLFGLRDSALIAGAVDPLATRSTAAAIEAYLLTLLP